MFQAAIKKTAEFTLPIVISFRRENGEVGSSIATFIVLNDEGWVLTAYHVIEHLQSLMEDMKSANAHKEKVAAIREDMSLSKSERKKRLRSIGKPPTNPVINFSVWWGRDEWQIEEVFECQSADLAIGKISEFDSSNITNYPIFKNPDVDFYPGVNLCKLGFPFHIFEPKYDEKNGCFIFPPGALPMPLFPMEGIFTRTAVVTEDESFPVEFVETSSPGLMGQSGGPTFDSEGRIWALQSVTVHHPLGFSPDIPGQRGQEHQFLNTGMGTHSKTIINFLRSCGVKYNMSND